MRILLIGNFLSLETGIRGVSEDLADHLSNLGWTVLVTSRKVPRLTRLIDYFLTIWLRRSEYEIAHVEVYSGLAFGLAEIACLILKLLKKPYAVTLHGGNLPIFAQRWPRRVKRLLGSADAVIVPSHFLYEQMKLFRKQMVLLPNPLNLRAYKFQKRYHPCPSLVWLRSFHQIYNPILGVKVASLLVSEFPELRLTMIGPNKGDGSLQATIAMADKLGVRERILFPGRIAKEEVTNWLQRGDIFINTTNIDNTPVSVMEALACGLCVVSTNVGGIPYLLDDNEDALLIPPDDPQAMADAIRRILTEPGLAEKLSANARCKAEQFDWSVILPQWESLFQSLYSREI